MRRTLADAVQTEMSVNKDIWLLTGDLGYKMWDECFTVYPERCINCGASEQAMMDIAVGLSYAGKIPIVYSITPFLLYRAFETLRTYINYEKLNVKLIGGGRNRDYQRDGISHWADDAGVILKGLPNIVQEWPAEKEDVKKIVQKMVRNNGPYFVSLKR